MWARLRNIFLYWKVNAVILEGRPPPALPKSYIDSMVLALNDFLAQLLSSSLQKENVKVSPMEIELLYYFKLLNKPATLDQIIKENNRLFCHITTTFFVFCVFLYVFSPYHSTREKFQFLCNLV